MDASILNPETIQPTAPETHSSNVSQSSSLSVTLNTKSILILLSLTRSWSYGVQTIYTPSLLHIAIKISSWSANLASLSNLSMWTLNWTMSDHKSLLRLDLDLRTGRFLLILLSRLLRGGEHMGSRGRRGGSWLFWVLLSSSFFHSLTSRSVLVSVCRVGGRKWPRGRGRGL